MLTVSLSNQGRKLKTDLAMPIAKLGMKWKGKKKWLVKTAEQR